ncbi:uncharacterized protein LOC111270243 isoform X2 [Varroa jacobsoni]|uniref:uncharacterized protein LOC111270243 isoform X2 n=1 Tax=Varroa jacobsoni TaxID=62625 RepID=UPI000BF8FC64|nr:uncharacterized protein LOC111270243 isoform X2 [Varroa jacobsoni]
MSAPTETNKQIGADTQANETGTTTISSVAIQSGATKLVLALLQCAECIKLKIQEMVPLFTDIGSNLEEASQLCKQHDSVLEKLQGQQNPVEELLKQADETITRQKPRKEVYQAMADSLGHAWRDLNSQLEQRKLILHQAVMFHTRARTLLEKLTRAEMEFGESFIPHDAQKCHQALEQLRTAREALTNCSKQLSTEADLLLDFVRPIAERSLADSRSEYMRKAAEKTLREISDYEEFLQTKMAEVEVILSQREFMLIGSTRKRELEEGLRSLEEWYRSVSKKILDERSLGSSSQTTQAILNDLIGKLDDVKNKRQAAIKLLKSTEDPSCGGYTSSDLQQRAYLLLSNITDVEESLHTRIEYLHKAQDFFTKTDEIIGNNKDDADADCAKRKEILVKEAQDLVKFYEVEPSAVAGVKIALNKLINRTTAETITSTISQTSTSGRKKADTTGGQSLLSSRPKISEEKLLMKSAAQRPNKPLPAVPNLSAREKVESTLTTETAKVSTTQDQPAAANDERSLLTSPTESDLYEEVTPQSLNEDKLQPDVPRKLEKYKESLVNESIQDTFPSKDQVAPQQIETIQAPPASVEGSFDQKVVCKSMDKEIKEKKTTYKEVHLEEAKITSTGILRKEFKSEVKLQVATMIADTKTTPSRCIDEQTNDQAFVIQRSPSFVNFCSKICSIEKWLHEVLDAFLQQNVAIGADLINVKKFYQEHSKIQNDLKVKEMDALAAFSTLPAVLSIGGDDAADAQKHGQKLRDDWERIGNILELRVRLAQRYVNFLKLSVQLSSDMSEVEESVGRARADLSEVEQKNLFQSWMNAQQAIVQFNHQAKIIQDDAKRMQDPYLDVAALVSAVQAVQATVSTRRDILKKTFDVWEDRKRSPPPPKISQAEQLMRETQRTKESAQKLEKELFPIIPRELNRAESIRRYLNRHIDTLMPLVRTVQSELEVRLRSMDHLLTKAQHESEKKELLKVKDVLEEALSRLLTKISDYESIVEKLAGFLVNVEKMEKSAETVEKLGKGSGCDPIALEDLGRALETQQTHALDRVVILAQESDQLVQLIDKLEPAAAATRDKEKISRLVEATRQHFESVLSQQKVKLAESKKLLDFKANTQMLNQRIDQLSEDLSSLRSAFGDNFIAAKTAQTSFEHFEETVKCLERQINEFVKLSQRLTSDRRLDTRQVKSEVASLQFKWNAFTRLVQDNRKLVDVGVLYFSVLDETEKWYRETNDYLVRVNQLCNNAQRADKEVLLNEVQSRIHSSQLDQEDRLKKLISLGQQLYQGRVPANAERVIQETRTVLETLQLLVAQLRKQSMQASLMQFQQPAIPQQPTKSQSFASQSSFQTSFSSTQEVKSMFLQSQEKNTKAFTSVHEEQTRSFRQVEQHAPAPVKRMHSVQLFRAPNNSEVGGQTTVASCPSSVAEDVPATSRSKTFPRNASSARRNLPAVGGLLSSSSYPFFAVPLEDIETPELRRVTLRCVVQAFPAPRISWYKDGTMIRPNNYITPTFDDSTGECTLCMQEVFVADSGLYSCKAVNSSGLAETKARLCVRGERFRIRLY